LCWVLLELISASFASFASINNKKCIAGIAQWPRQPSMDGWTFLKQIDFENIAYVRNLIFPDGSPGISNGQKR
jgi:hypothetical protein